VAGLFRTTVASRLLNAIRDVRNTINSINLPLKKPIGDSQYHIQVEDNAAKEFVEYRRVLDACAVTRKDNRSLPPWKEKPARAWSESSRLWWRIRTGNWPSPSSITGVTFVTTCW